LCGREELTVVAVERVEKAIAPEMGDDVAILAVDLGVDQLIDPNLVVIEEVARRVLEIPDHLSSVDVQAKGRIGEQVVARTEFRIEHRNRLAGTPDRQLRLRIV
jgi:hypothetical protein